MYKKVNHYMQNKHPTLSIILRSSIFWIILVSFAMLYTVISLFITFLDVKLRHKIIASWSNIFIFLAKHLCQVKYKVIGKENIIKTPSIIASNHQSMYETVAFNLVFPAHVWIMKKELLRVPFFGWTIATLSPIAIDRKNRSGSVAQILSQGLIKIKKGFYIMLYPEGTRVAPGKKIVFKSGAGRIATTLKLPILPVSHNAGYILPKHSFCIYPGTVTIVIDKAIFPREDDTAESITKRVEEAVQKNLNTILSKE